jgi:hypothetical protein
MTPKLVIAAVLAAAIAVGFALPGPHDSHANVKAQIPMQEIGNG